MDFTKNKSAFVVIEKISSKEIGLTNSKFNELEKKEVITTSALTIVQVSAFGNNALYLIEKLRMVLRSGFASKELNFFKIGLISMSDIRNLSTDFGAGYEERASIDLTLSHENKVQTDVKVMPLSDVEINSENDYQKTTINNPKYEE